MRRVAVALAAIVVYQSTGCAVVMNGRTSRVEVKSSTPGAKVYVDGFDVTNTHVEVPNDNNHIVLVRAPGYADHVELLEPHVAAAPIVLDIVLAAPSFLIAPLCDLALGPWFKVSSIERPIQLTAAVKTPRPRPVYQVGSVAIESRAGNVKATQSKVPAAPSAKSADRAAPSPID